MISERSNFSSKRSKLDQSLLSHISQLAKLLRSRLLLVHVADGWVARNYETLQLAESEEMKTDRAYLESSAERLRAEGLDVSTMAGSKYWGDRVKPCPVRARASISRPDWPPKMSFCLTPRPPFVLSSLVLMTPVLDIDFGCCCRPGHISRGFGGTML